MLGSLERMLAILTESYGGKWYKFRFLFKKTFLIVIIFNLGHSGYHHVRWLLYLYFHP